MVCSGFAQDVEAEVAPGFGPFVVLFGQHGADEADQRGAVGEDADDVGAAADLLVEPLLYPALGGGSTRQGLDVQLVEAVEVVVEGVRRRGRGVRLRWSSRGVSASVLRAWTSSSWSVSAARNSGAVV